MLDTQHLALVAIFVGLFLLVCGPVHECAHAYMAWRLGDGTAKLFGRVTLNPVAHLDPVGALMLAITALSGIGLGWAKPTPVNPYNLRGRYADSLVAAAGPISNLVLAAVFAVAFRIVAPGHFIWDSQLAYDYENSWIGLLALVLWIGVQLNVILAIFNLIPVPPLDGSHVLFDVLDPRTAREIRPLFDQYGIFILILLILPLTPSGSVLGIVLQKVGLPIISLLVGAPPIG